MATKIKIGADELILWLRKNNKAKNVTNQTLGLKILNLIEKDLMIGTKIIDDQKSLWGNSFDDEKGLGLPKTAAQYEIDSSMLKELYGTLNKW
ncbi:MAG: hypothetical protein LBI15_04025 [Dysgonamonadaceae bacterium]|jgi:hypothetical protein|nr:hypothetical protein [Dysgonamonadaceae bacterium]